MNESQLPNKAKESLKSISTQKKQLASAIGLLVIHFNQVESEIGEFLALFLNKTSLENDSKNIAIMAASLSFSQKLDLLSALYLNRYKSVPAQSDLFRQIISKLSKYEEYRNTIIHSRWGTRYLGEETIRRFKSNVKGRKGLREVEEEVDWKQIKAISYELMDFQYEEMMSIYSGCGSYKEMTDELIIKLKESLKKRLNGV